MLNYLPSDLCLELESFKLYLLAYRNLGVFQENVVNRVLDEVVAACSPASATVEGHFEARGGLLTRIAATHRVLIESEPSRQPVHPSASDRSAVPGEFRCAPGDAPAGGIP